MPYAFLVLSYGNEVFQVMIPTPERDRALAQITLMQFPVVLDLVYNASDSPRRADIDLSGHQIVKGKKVNFTMAFENVTHRRIRGSATSTETS